MMIMMVYDGDEDCHDNGDDDDDAALLLWLSSGSVVAAVALHPELHVQQPAARAHGPQPHRAHEEDRPQVTDK
jgi:hypothetical protein